MGFSRHFCDYEHKRGMTCRPQWRNGLRKPRVKPQPHSPHKELPHLLTPRAHQLLVLPDAQLLAVDDAGPLGPRLVLVVGIFLQVDLAEAGLLLIVRLLLLIGHGFPART